MNKNFKKVLSLLMTLAMILTALPLAGFTAFAEAYAGDPNEHTSGDFRYIIWANNTVGISGYTGSAEKLNIPSKLDTYTVTSIEYGAFEGCDNLISVSIPNSVTSIGEDAFLNTGYYNNQANWQNGALYIDNCLIEAKSNEIPQNYKINEGTRVIADSAFEDCDSLTSVTIPEGVTSIGRLAFSYCDNLTSVAIGNGVTSIGDDAFSCCYSLTSVTIPNSVTSIGESVFYECYSLTSVTIPKGVTNIGYWAFGYCHSLASVTIPESVANIDNLAFDHCDSLTDIYILNKDCNIRSDNKYPLTIPTETTIHGYKNSTAESYAKEYGNKFMAINAIGDVDGNANITITDAKWILQNTVKSRNFTEAQAKAADLNKDGKVTIVDAKWVLQIVVGLRDAQTLKPIKK